MYIITEPENSGSILIGGHFICSHAGKTEIVLTDVFEVIQVIARSNICQQQRPAFIGGAILLQLHHFRNFFTNMPEIINYVIMRCVPASKSVTKKLFGRKHLR